MSDVVVKEKPCDNCKIRGFYAGCEEKCIMYRKYKLYQQGRKDEQEFVEKRCKELGIDYIAIYTCHSAD